MGQEFFINSQELENKIRQLLPSQGGAGAGFDLSASTQIIPIIDLTESASGSNLRQDLQSSLSHASVTSFDVINTTTSIIVNTGYHRVFGTMSVNKTNFDDVFFSISDGATDKVILDGNVELLITAVGALGHISYDFIVFLSAGDSLKATSDSVDLRIVGCTRQLADIDGVLVNPN
tara:strand:+ start:116 stop:643 length:528 start_codon:yes stop_codon:yes gene_type:complete